jgi:hypothetical protein
MATVAFQVTRTGQTTANKTVTYADADFDKMVAAYQSDANVSINGTATYAQVLNYIVVSVWTQAVIQKIQQANTTPPVVPAPIVVS